MTAAEQRFRVEKDSMGEVKVPQQAYYGAQTQRAVENFPISSETFPARIYPSARAHQAGGSTGQSGVRPARRAPQYGNYTGGPGNCRG